ncbi:integral membrane protein [Zalerion maritima]|uniref:Integral membrane protein n=1 Tax=Zalerion maritima TaxID=339359 RepID=A0AAD5RUV3_9PEZI|nr:integral membrane protein [Zalerion maritima]
MPAPTRIPARAVIPFLVAMMLLSGVTNTLLTKYQDQQCLGNCDNPDPKKREHFEQPVIQTAQMFVGEMGCWLVVGAMALYDHYVSGKMSPTLRGYEALHPNNTNDDDDDDPDDDASINSSSPLNSRASARAFTQLDSKDVFLSGWRICLLALPAICDICGTTLMNAGLLLVAASIYQMTRGALVLFVGAFSVIFLHRRLHIFQWISLGGVVLGVAVVGLAGALYPDSKQGVTTSASLLAARLNPAASASPELSDTVKAVIGVLLIASAQIFTASQFVLEEWIFEKSNLRPLNAVGWEGIFGFSVTCVGMAILHLAIGRTDAGRHGYFDIAHGWSQMVNNPPIFLSSLLIMVSIGCFNFFGLSVTRSVSATSRSTIDTCRTLFIWIVSLGLGWESFKWLQVVGFVLLVYFTFLYNGIVQPPLACLRVDEVEELLPEEPIEHH